MWIQEKQIIIKNKQKMETPIGNIPGDFEQVELSCPRCSYAQVIVEANENGYFEVKECPKCGFRKS